MSAPAVQDWFTARELAELVKGRGLTGFPASERRVRDLADREGWNELPARLARWRVGSGRPAMEYHQSILPERLQVTIAAGRQQLALQGALAAEAEADRRRIAAVRAGALSSRARGVMEARAGILTSIDGYAAANGKSRAWAIGKFLEAQETWLARQDSERRRDDAHVLTHREAEALAQPLVLTAPGGFGIDPATIAMGNDRRQGQIVSERTLQRWFKARAEQGIAALAPAPTKEVQQVPAEFGEFLRFYARPTKPSVVDAHAAYLQAAGSRAGSQPMTLSLDQVRYILRERMNNVERQVGREGLLTLRSRLAYVTRTTEDMWPTTIYSADGKTFDAEIADPVTKLPIRPEITTVIDVVTRKIVGTSLGRSENQRSVAEALRRSCIAHGIPAIFYVDRGPGFRNQAMDADVSGLMGRLGITKMHAAPYGSQAKGRVERPQATVWDRLARRLPSYIGDGMDKEAGQAFHKASRREIKAFGETKRLPSWADFVAMCDTAVVEYNARPHRGLPRFEDPATGKTRHMSPDEAWAAHVAAGFEPVPVDPEEADDLFRPYEIRTVRRSLVQWNTNTYFHEALEAWHEEKVMVGYDWHQADRVWVRAFDVSTGQPGALICVAAFGGNAERYVPLSYEQKALETRSAGRLKRVDAKRGTIEAERDALRLVDMTPAVGTPLMGAAPAVDLQPAGTATDSETPKALRRVFASDEDLAAWALVHPDQVSRSQIAVLTDCLARPSARDHLRMSGIDLEALRALIRAAA